MEKTFRLYNIIAAALLIVASFVSVAGYQQTQTNEKTTSSPLFTIRTQQAINQQGQTGFSTFLGKGKKLNIFPSASFPFETMIQTALRFFGSNPTLLYKLVENLNKYPAVTDLLAKQGVSKVDIKYYMLVLQQNPSLIIQAISDTRQFVPNEDPPEPLGLSTSNPIGCYIVAIAALLPITITLTLLLLFFTLRILTCMNVNDCANVIAKGIWDQLIQGLAQE